jgi:hypothetical protein
MPAAEEVTSLMENLTSQMRHRANQFTGPVLAQTSPNPAESWFGSGVRVEINGRYFVATAAHVVEDGRPVLPTHGLGQDEWDRVESIWAGQNPTLDIAWMEVTPGPAFRSEEWLPLDFIGLEAGLPERDLLVLLLGYPGQYWELNQEARTLFSEAICFPSSTVPVVGADAGHLLSVDLPPGHEMHGRGTTSEEVPGNGRVPLRGAGWSRVFRVLNEENDLLVPYPLDVVARGPDGTEVAVDVPKARWAVRKRCLGIWGQPGRDILAARTWPPCWNSSNVRGGRGALSPSPGPGPAQSVRCALRNAGGTRAKTAGQQRGGTPPRH